MKFYEVQPALEAGKKIRRKSIYKNVLGISLSKCLRNMYVEVFADGGESIWEMNSHDLRADDWEILDEPQKVPVKTKTVEYITCSKCGKDIEVEHTWETIHCKHCNNVMALESQMNNLEYAKDVLKKIGKGDSSQFSTNGTSEVVTIYPAIYYVYKSTYSP